jgi:hypothetical protein
MITKRRRTSRMRMKMTGAMNNYRKDIARRVGKIIRK